MLFARLCRRGSLPCAAPRAASLYVAPLLSWRPVNASSRVAGQRPCARRRRAAKRPHPPPAPARRSAQPLAAVSRLRARPARPARPARNALRPRRLARRQRQRQGQRRRSCLSDRSDQNLVVKNSFGNQIDASDNTMQFDVLRSSEGKLASERPERGVDARASCAAARARACHISGWVRMRGTWGRPPALGGPACDGRILNAPPRRGHRQRSQRARRPMGHHTSPRKDRRPIHALAARAPQSARMMPHARRTCFAHHARRGAGGWRRRRVSRWRRPMAPQVPLPCFNLPSLPPVGAFAALRSAAGRQRHRRLDAMIWSA